MSLRVKAHPYFRERLTDGWYQGYPMILRYRFRFFHPADINAFERFNLRRVVFDAVEHEFSIRSGDDESWNAEFQTQPNTLHARWYLQATGLPNR